MVTPLGSCSCVATGIAGGAGGAIFNSEKPEAWGRWRFGRRRGATSTRGDKRRFQ